MIEPLPMVTGPRIISAGIDHDVVADRRMPRAPVAVDRGRWIGMRASPERDAVRDLHAPADDSPLANHHAGTVIDKETTINFCPGMNVDAGQAMSDFSDNPRGERSTEKPCSTWASR